MHGPHREAARLAPAPVPDRPRRRRPARRCGLGALLLAGAQTAERRERAERRAVVTLSALAAVRRPGERRQRPGGGAGRRSRRNAAEAAEGGMGLGRRDRGGRAARPGAHRRRGRRRAQGGRGLRRRPPRGGRHPRGRHSTASRLEASTDRGGPAATKAAPRRLERDEKPLYDLGQKLRAARREQPPGGRGGGPRARARVRAAARTAVLALAAPVERGGEVMGMVQMETRRVP